MPGYASLFLLDNGSLEPAATLGLRRLAAELSQRAGQLVQPVSLLHSSGIEPAALNGTPAEIFEPAVQARAREGAREFVVVPLFFGPSRALTDYLPERVRALREAHPGLSVRLGPPLFQPNDERLARILCDQIRATNAAARRVALVDHGSPVAAVTAVRDALAAQLRRLLGPSVEIATASMECRPEPRYDFNRPLLADLLSTAPWNSGEVTLAMQFLLPGRHAGPDGDIAKICREAEACHAGLVTRMTPLVATHPLLLEILADRLAQAQASAPLT